MNAEAFLPCEHEQKGSFQTGERSDAAILEGARLHPAVPHGWGNSMSKSEKIQMSVNNQYMLGMRLTVVITSSKSNPSVSRYHLMFW